MSEHKAPTTKTYFIIFAWLIVFTIVEVGAAGLAIDKLAVAAILIGTAIGKALRLLAKQREAQGKSRFLLQRVPLSRKKGSSEEGSKAGDRRCAIENPTPKG